MARQGRSLATLFGCVGIFGGALVLGYQYLARLPGGASGIALVQQPSELSDWLALSCVPFGYPMGKWGVAKRRPAHEVSYRNSWGTPLGLEINEPLWP